MADVKSAFEVYHKQQNKKKRRLSLDPEQPENVTKKNKLDKKQQNSVKNAQIQKNLKPDLKLKKKKSKKVNSTKLDGVDLEKKSSPFKFAPAPLTTGFKLSTLKASEPNYHVNTEESEEESQVVIRPTVLLSKKSKVKAKSPENTAASNHKSEKKIRKVKNGNISSEEEIPTLVPIRSSKVKTSKKTKTKLVPSLSSKEHSKVVSKKKAKPFNPLTYSLGIFKWLLDPVGPEEFFTTYWEKHTMHITRKNAKYYDGVFSTRKLDQILRENPLHYQRNINVVIYEDGKKSEMDLEGRAMPNELWDFYANGCSIRVLNPHTYDENIHMIISNLQEYFGSMVGTNVYLTPPHSQGFAPHYDDIEAFIIQLEGSKYWKLYEPSEKQKLTRFSSHNFEREELGKPFMEVKLKAGDLLYFPRGTIHEGYTQNEHSLHITVSVYQRTSYADLLDHALPAAIEKAAAENIKFREGLPLNYLKHLGAVNKNDNSYTRKLIIDRVKALFNNLVDYLDVDAAADLLGRKLMHDAMPPLHSHEEEQNSCKRDGDFLVNGKVYNRVEFNPEVKVRLLRYYGVRLVKESSGTSKIYYCTDNAKTYHGEEEQWLEIDNSLIPGLEMLQKRYPEFVEIEQLPISDETEKLTFVSSLWEHGLIVTDGPLPTFENGTESDTDDTSKSSDSECENS